MVSTGVAEWEMGGVFPQGTHGMSGDSFGCHSLEGGYQWYLMGRS